MRDIGDGFRIGERQFAWGVTADAVADLLAVPREAGRGSRWRTIEVACGSTYGFDTISAELTACGDDRPVTALKYELDARGADPLPPPEPWVEAISAWLGRPVEDQRHHLPANAHPSGSVRHSARWAAGEQSVGLSLYGAPREVAHGAAIGCIWLNWSTEAAARPFLPEWRERASMLATEAGKHSGLVSYSLVEQQTPHLGWRDPTHRDSLFALSSRELLPTPEPIARRLGKHGIGFWRSGDQRSWHASTFWDTISFEIDRPLTIDWYDIKPAKGGGFSEIAVRDWSARDLHGSRAIANAVEALQSIPGVTIRKVDGYDC